jgi:hypothetical protein
MTHTRTLVREHIARQLVNAGAWADAIYIDRATALSDDENWPNICIYTQTERTKQTLGPNTRKQTLSLLIEVRERRTPDMQQHWRRNVEGMPQHPAQTGDASRKLDDACKVIEDLVIQLFSKKRLVLEGTTLDFDQIDEVNTDLARSAEGEVPHVLAQIEFKLDYAACTDRVDLASCPLELMFGEIRFQTCKPNDPMNGQVAVALTRHTPQPALAEGSYGATNIT